MRHLVTGGAGFIGSHVVDALVARDDTVIVLDNLSTGRRQNLEAASASGRAEIVEGSTSDLGLVHECMREVDNCLHLASAVGVQLVVDHALDSLRNNVHGADNVMHAAAKYATRLLFASTSEIYGKNSEGALHEESDRLLGPPQMERWGYAISKSYGEALAIGLHKEQAAENTVVRLFNTTGPRQRSAYGMVLPRFVQQAMSGEPLTVYGDGSQSRCFAHVEDSVQALLMLIDRDDAVGGIFNVGAVTEITIMQLAQTVIERLQSDSEIICIPFDEAYGEGFEELGRRRPDTTALRELTGWNPERTVEDAILDMAAYLSQTEPATELV